MAHWQGSVGSLACGLRSVDVSSKAGSNHRAAEVGGRAQRAVCKVQFFLLDALGFTGLEPAFPIQQLRIAGTHCALATSASHPFPYPVPHGRSAGVVI